MGGQKRKKESRGNLNLDGALKSQGESWEEEKQSKAARGIIRAVLGGGCGSP